MPENMDIELRIYQNDDVMELFPEAQDVRDIMETIVRFDKLLNKIKLEEI